MILVTGATGNAGGGVVRGLLALGADVRGLVRPGSESKLPGGVEAAPGDLNDPDSLREHLTGVSAVFLLSGYEGLERTLELMSEAGVERVVLLSSSAAPSGDLDNAVARYHILSERAVRDSGVPWTFLQPNSLMSNAYRWLPQLENGDVIHGPFGDVPIATIDPDDLGAVAAAALTTSEHEAKTYRLSGPEALRPAEQVAIMAEATGRRMRFEAWSDEEAMTEMERRREALPSAARFERPAWFPRITGADAVLGGLLLVVAFFSPVIGGPIAALFAYFAHQKGDLVQRNLALAGVAVSLVVLILVSFLPERSYELLPWIDLSGPLPTN